MVSIFRGKRIKGIGEAGLGLVPINKVSETPPQFQPSKKSEEFFEDESEITKYDRAYKNCGRVGTSIDNTAEQVVQSFNFDGPQSKQLDKWADDINLGLWMVEVVQTMLKHGKCYGELVSIDKKIFKDMLKSKLKNPLDPNKILATASMGYIKPKTDIKPSHYLQKDGTDNKTFWGGRAPEKYPQAKKGGKLEDIYRFVWNGGLSIIHSSLVLVTTKDSMETDLPIITKRYVAPIIDLEVGNEDNQPDEDDINAVKTQVEDIYADTEFVHSYLVKSKVLGFQGKLVDTSPLFMHIDNNIEVGMQTPLDLFYGKGEGGKGADTKSRNYGRHIKHIQRILKANIEDQIVSRMTGNRENKLIWGYAEEREKEMEIDIVRGLKTDGIITPQKANELLPEKYHEELPEDFGEENDKERTPDAEGANALKDRHGKTDPTKSTQLEKGKRLDKKDKSVTLKRVV